MSSSRLKLLHSFIFGSGRNWIFLVFALRDIGIHPGDAGRNEIEFHRRFEWFTHLPVSEGRSLSWNIAATMCLRKTFWLFYILFGHSIKFPTLRITTNRRAVVTVIHVVSRDAHNTERCHVTWLKTSLVRSITFFKRGAITLEIHELIREIK